MSLSVLLANLILTLIPEQQMELLTQPNSLTNANSHLFATESPTTDVPLTLSFLPTEECNSLGAQFPLMPMET